MYLPAFIYVYEKTYYPLIMQPYRLFDGEL